jgi:cell division septation protein DedD
VTRGERRDGEPGWLVSLLGAGVLIAGGFVVGLIVGVVSEEPELVVGHLAGNSEEVSWLADDATTASDGTLEVNDGEPLGAREVAARRSSVLGEAEERAGEVPVDLPSVAAKPSDKALPPVAAGPPNTRRRARSIDDLPTVAPSARRASSRSTFAVQVGAFSDPAAAGRVRDDLSRKGFDVYLVPGTKSDDRRSRVRVGPVASKADAQALADRLKREERLPTWVLSESDI